MAWPSNRPLKRDEIVAIDLGQRITKAVHLRRKGTTVQLENYILMDAPIYEKAPSVESLSEHLQAVWRALGASTRHVTLVVNAASALLCHAELPVASIPDLRRMVKLSPKNYLQQELPDYSFDCYAKTDPTEDGAARIRRKVRVLVGGAKARLVETLKEAARQAGLTVEQITIAQVGLANAFKMLSSDSHGDVVALLDIGFNQSTINIVMKGELALTRVVNIGAERIAQAMAQPHAKDVNDPGHADVPMSEALQSKLHNLFVLLGKEVDASIGFFVNNQEVTVNQVYVSGGSARSQFIVQALESELALPCETWNPTKSLTLNLPAAQMKEIEFDASQLSAAIGAGLSCVQTDLISINLLAEEQEVIEARRRDPVRRGYLVAATAVALMFVWAGYLRFDIWREEAAFKSQEIELQTLQRNSRESIAITSRAGEIDRTLAALNKLAANRFLWAPTLNALQYTTVPGVEFHRVRLEQSHTTEIRSASTNKAANVVEKMVLSIQAKNYGDAQAMEKLIDTIAAFPYFTNTLRRDQPVLLKDLLQRQVDPGNAANTFVFFTTECYYSDRVLKNE
jgi:type IV pilus assembly protein PilM